MSALLTPENVRAVRRSLALIVAGLGVQLACAFFWSPGTFLLSALVGVPLVVLGALLGWFHRSRASSHSGEPQK